MGLGCVGLTKVFHPFVPFQVHPSTTERTEPIVHTTTESIQEKEEDKKGEQPPHNPSIPQSLVEASSRPTPDASTDASAKTPKNNHVDKKDRPTRMTALASVASSAPETTPPAEKVAQRNAKPLAIKTGGPLTTIEVVTVCGECGGGTACGVVDKGQERPASGACLRKYGESCDNDEDCCFLVRKRKITSEECVGMEQHKVGRC